MGTFNFVSELLELTHIDNELKARHKALKSYNQKPQQAFLPGPSLKIISFVTGRRPIDEASYPGLGSSDNACMILGEDLQGDNRTYILFQLDGLTPAILEKAEALALDVTLTFTGPDGSLTPTPIPGWQRRPIPFQVFVPGGHSQPVVLGPIAPSQIKGQRLVLEIVPERDLLPGGEWNWPDLDSQLVSTATDSADPFTFGHLFLQQLNVTLQLSLDGTPLATAQTWLDVCDTRRFGSLYQRILEQVIYPDTERQAVAAGVANLDPAFHPWFPVLLIGSDKAALYTQALIEDIVYKKRHLTDPRWLMRVGIYLEFLTCLAIFEAVKDDLGDLLTPAERSAYENSPFFASIRQHLNVAGWRKVWKLHQISLPRFGTPNTGPVSSLNLLQKKKATLAFLEVHHQDLKHAIELAGVNTHNSQETWYRVFRDAERAILRKTPKAFPELSFLPERVQQVILWHRKGYVSLPFFKKHPIQIGRIPGDQDGLFASACNQYRLSMNEVAEWARQRNLMDYTGSECVPQSVSLLEACMNNNENQFEQLQHRDGYIGKKLNFSAKVPPIQLHSTEQIYRLLSQVSLFKPLSETELGCLAKLVREIHLGPMERILIEGQPGSSLFIIGDGVLEVLARQPNGVDRRIGTGERGEVLGEIALLSGTPRQATVRAIGAAVVYEIGQQQFEPLIQTHPELVEKLLIQMEYNLGLFKLIPSSTWL